eukprot:652632_1
MPPKHAQNTRKKRSNFNKRNRKKKPQQKNKKKVKQGDRDLSELMSIFSSVKGKARSNRQSKSKAKKSKSKQENSTIIKNENETQNTNNSVAPAPFVSRKRQSKMERKERSKKQLKSLPNNVLIPKCSLCHYKLMIKRGDACYEDYASVSCDYCGREDIHGEVWHCDRCAKQPKKDTNGFNLCRTCGYLISHNRQNEIRRVAPPPDDMSLLGNKALRTRTKTLDGFTIYKHDEIQKTLNIGTGGNTKLCPFDCQCCF